MLDATSCIGANRTSWGRGYRETDLAAPRTVIVRCMCLTETCHAGRDFAIDRKKLEAVGKVPHTVKVKPPG
jgi:hypothetical protein